MTDQNLMAEATRLTREGRLSEATALLRGDRAAPAPQRPRPSGRTRSGLADTLAGLVREAKAGGQARPAAAPAVPDGASWERRVHSCAAGERPYALYTPSRLAAEPAVLLMLHGCTQDAADFARGTRMNEHAERHGFLVAYPEQPRSENQNGCWNWFEPRHQGQGTGETAILADLARTLSGEHGGGRAYVAGLSAGGAAAANLVSAFPHVFSGACVHSGLPAGAASGLPDALRAMQAGAEAVHDDAQPVPMLIVHGDADRTVSPRNADALERQALGPATSTVQSSETASMGGRRVTRTTEALPSGAVLCERLTVQGGRHAWFGGDPSGSHADAKGPDASAELVRFFGLDR